MDESVTETLHRATDLASKGTKYTTNVWDITRNARNLSSFSTEIETVTDEVLPYCGLPLQVSTLKETCGYQETLWEMLKSTPGEQIAKAKCEEEDGLTVVAIATIAVLCAECGLYPPFLVEMKNIASLLWDWSECDVDTEDDSDASTDDVYDDNVDRYRRGAEAALKEDKSSHHGRN
ncbi:hypothetical protein NHJ6243_010140 [Beauveria neobassiana]